MVVRVVLLALACAVVVHLFCFVLHSAAHGLPKLLPNRGCGPFLGGCVVVVSLCCMAACAITARA